MRCIVIASFNGANYKYIEVYELLEAELVFPFEEASYISYPTFIVYIL